MTGFITIDRIDGMVRSRLKTMDEQGRIDPDDIVEYSLKALQSIGTTGSMEDLWACVKIHNHKGKMPENLMHVVLTYKIQDTNVLNFTNLFKITTNVSETQEVTEDCNPTTTTTTTTTTVVTKQDCDGTELLSVAKKISFTELVKILNVSTPMYYGGSDLSLLADSDSNVFVGGMDSYIRRGRSEIVTSFKEGTVLINYLDFAKDDDGRPMIPDSDEVIDAVVAYNIFMLVAPDFYDKTEGSVTVYQEAKTNWENFRAHARNSLQLISIDQAYAKAVATANRYWRFRLKDTYPFKYYR